MKPSVIKSFINQWNILFGKHHWIEAFMLSIVFHIIFLNFIWLCCQIHVMIFPEKPITQIIEIEFINN
ncbi:MAG: hypothetical protein HYR97_05535 [Candidatus Melainabacteria bacterium]|nr:hypothetical protein [Candidatus Melainabacteria bacterium]